jgi:hypothetical protein
MKGKFFAFFVTIALYILRGIVENPKNKK